MVARLDALKRLQAETAAKLDVSLPAILQSSPGFGGTRDRAWTHSSPTRSGCALLLRKMDLLVPTRSALRAFVLQIGTNSFHRFPSGSSRLVCSQHTRLKVEL
jgi:hypothetical protein